ncbi:MAG: S-layer homology domain-containing protein [Bacillota bacterium]|jgi:hypothetical protein
MKKSILAAIIVAVAVICGVSAYAIQGLDETKSTRILANDGYATLTAESVGGTVSTTSSALLAAAGSSYPGVHVTDTYSVFTLDAAFINSLLASTNSDVISFQFKYNLAKTAVTFTIRDGDGNAIFAPKGRCVGELPYQAESSANDNHVYVLNPSSDPVAMSSYYPDAGYVHFQLKTNGTYTVSTKNASFSDTTNHWGRNYIEFLASRGVANGVGNGLFSPNGTVTRAQYVMFLANISMDDVSSYNSNRFSDVSSGAWYYHAVSWAVQNKITSGVSTVLFAPNQNVTREQMTELTKNFFNYMGIEMKPIRSAANFSDESKISAWAKDSVGRCQTMAIISGYPNGTFGPQGNATRAEAATICSRVIAYSMLLPQ